MKKNLSFLTLFFILFSYAVPFFGTANAFLETKKVRVVVTYPISDATLGVDAGSLVHEPTLGIPFRFSLKNSSGNTICMEEKTLPVVNGIMTYLLGNQYSINSNGVTTGCNISTLINTYDYKVVVTGDLNRNGTYSDLVDFTSEDAVWKQTSSQMFDDSFLDSKTLDIQNNISKLNSGSGININYDQEYKDLNSKLIGAGQKTKTFDLDKDSITEVLAKSGTNNGVIYSANKINGTYENVGSTAKLTLDDSTNVFVSGKSDNFILYGSFGVNPSTTLTNVAATSIVMKNGMVTEASQTVKQFVATSYLIMNINGNDITFNYSSLTRQYEEQITVSYGTTSQLYTSTTSPSWTGTPFAGDTTDYFGGTVREANINGTIVSDIDGVIYGDFNKDNKLDFITYKNYTGGKAYFNIYLRLADGTYKIILNDILADGVTAGTTLIDNSSDFGGNDINEIIFTNGKINDIYKINSAWQTAQIGDGISYTMKKIGSFEASFYSILSKNGGTTNIDQSYLSIGDGFRDMNDSYINDKLLLVGNYKVDKDGYPYYDYYIKKFNGSEFVDLNFETGSPFKMTGSKIGFTKVGTSGFYVFYVDRSTNYTKGLPDKTDLFYVHTNKVVQLMKDVVVNTNNTVSTQDGNLNEGGSKLLKNSTFGIFGLNVDNITSGFFTLDKANYSSRILNSSASMFDGFFPYSSSKNVGNIIRVDNTYQLTDTQYIDNVVINQSMGTGTSYYGVVLIKIYDENNNLIYDSSLALNNISGVNTYNIPIGKVLKSGSKIIVRYNDSSGYYLSSGLSSTINYLYKNNDTFVFNKSGEINVQPYTSMSVINQSFDGVSILDLNGVIKQTEKLSVYNKIKGMNWGFGKPRDFLTNVSRNLISNYISESNFINTSTIKLSSLSPTDIAVFDGNLTDIGIASLGNNITKHTVNNLKQDTNTTIWGTLNSNILFLDNLNSKIMFYDVSGLGFFDKTLLTRYGGNSIPYLDTGNYKGAGVNKVVFGDNSYSSTTGGATNNDYGGLNKSFSAPTGMYKIVTTKHITWASNTSYYAYSYNQVNQDGTISTINSGLTVYQIDGGPWRYMNYNFYPLY